MLTVTKDDGYRWNRPRVGPDSAKDGEPIPVYKSEVGMSNLVGLRDFNSEYAVLLFYDYETKGIDMIMFPRAIANQIYKGIDEDSDETGETADEDKGISERDPFVTDSWKQYFAGGSNVIVE